MKKLIILLGILLQLLSHCPDTCRAEIEYPPTIVKQPPPDTLIFQVAKGTDDGEKPFMLECEATGNPMPKYEWTKNGRNFKIQSHYDRISHQPGRGTLVVNSPRTEDEGYYQCLATNTYGTAVSSSVFVRKLDVGDFPREKPKELTVTEGQPLTLPCNPPTGFPKPRIVWAIQSRSGALRSINNPRITVDPEGALHFSNVTTSDGYDEIYYVCVASFAFQMDYKIGNKVTLKVLSSGSSGAQSKHPPIEQYKSPSHIVAIRGHTQEIHCIFGGTPLPSVRWGGLDRRLNNSRYTIINYGKTLKLKHVDLEDRGVYACTVGNGVGSPLSWSISITVEFAPYWITAPNNTNAAEEESVRFECQASGVPQPIVQWFINGIPLADAKSNSNRKLLSPTVMTIDNITKLDTAVYQCNASNALGYAFKNFYLNVFSLAPEITDPPEALYETVDGHTVILRCHVFGSPKPNVKWLRGGKDLTGGRYVIQHNGDLEIRNALFTDAGNYKCTASNKFGFVESSDEVGKLEVRQRTKITREPEDHEVTAGDSATFTCTVVADVNLQLEVDWLGNGQPIDYDDDPRMSKGADHSLTISKTTLKDTGPYTCVAKTRLENVTASALLIVQDLPNPPRLVAVECNLKTALIKWRPMGDNRAPILSYVVQYNTSFTPDTWEVASETVPASEFKFEVSLSPWTNYSFRVLARNKIGYSLPSDHSSTCQTQPDVPYKNPDHVRGQGTTPNNFVISWTPMPEIEHNAPGFYYKVYWKRNATVEWMTRTVTDWTHTNIVVDNQPTFIQPYVFKVEAHNIKGPANVAAVEVVGYSGQDYPQEAPQQFEILEVIDGNTVKMRWQPVPLESVRGHLKGYKIRSWAKREGHQGRKRLHEAIVPPNTTVAVVDIFQPFTVNYVNVLAFNDLYDGPASETIRFMTPEGRPGPVASFDAAPIGSSALRLVWMKPTDINGHLLGYKICYQLVDGLRLGPMIERKPWIDDPNAISTRLHGLEPNTKYRVTIKAYTVAGDGTPYLIEITTGDATDTRKQNALENGKISASDAVHSKARMDTIFFSFLYNVIICIIYYTNFLNL